MEKVGSWFHLCRMSSPQGRFWSCAGQEPFLGGRAGMGGGEKEGGAEKRPGGELGGARRCRETVHEHTQDNTEESSEPFRVGRQRRAAYATKVISLV